MDGLGRLGVGGRLRRRRGRAPRDPQRLPTCGTSRRFGVGRRGPHALAPADALFTNDMSTLEFGQVRYGAICYDGGKMIMDGTVFRVAADYCLSIPSYDSDLAWYRNSCR